MVNAIVAFVEALRVNCQLSSKVGDALAKLLHTRLDGDELFNCCKCLQAEKIDLGGKVESMAAEKDGFAKRIAELEARLRESESTLEGSELRAAKEREASMKLEEELILYKKKVVEQHEKGFQKAVKKVGFFAKDLDLGLFDPFKDVKEGVWLDEEQIDAEEKVVDEGQGVVKQGDDVCV